MSKSKIIEISCQGGSRLSRRDLARLLGYRSIEPIWFVQGELTCHVRDFRDVPKNLRKGSYYVWAICEIVKNASFITNYRGEQRCVMDRNLVTEILRDRSADYAKAQFQKIKRIQEC